MRILNGVPFDIASLPEDRPAGELFVLINQQNPEQPVIRFGMPPESGFIEDIGFHRQADGTWVDHDDDPSLLRLTDGFLRVTLKDVSGLIDSLPGDNGAVLARLKDLIDVCNDMINAGFLADGAEAAAELRERINFNDDASDDEDAANQAQALLNELEIEQELDAGSAEAAD